MKTQSRPFALFYLLVAYVILQFAWWTWLIVDLNQKLHEAHGNPEGTLKNKYLMIGGEALVFLILLILGMYRVRKSFLKEQEVSRQQKNFMLSVTHELKSPLSSIRLQVETIRRHQLTKEKQDQILGNAINDIERLNQLIENVLLASRMQSGTFPLSKEEVNLSDYIKENIREFRSLSTNLSVNLSGDESVFHSIDPLLFRSVIYNLLENSSKYGASEARVELKEKKDSILIEIKDNGPGINEEERENVFKMFYRSGNEETRRSRGTGLGLHIVKTLVEKHNGTINLEKNSSGGACFLIKLNK